MVCTPDHRNTCSIEIHVCISLLCSRPSAGEVCALSICVWASNFCFYLVPNCAVASALGGHNIRAARRHFPLPGCVRWVRTKTSRIKLIRSRDSLKFVDLLRIDSWGTCCLGYYRMAHSSVSPEVSFPVPVFGLVRFLNNKMALNVSCWVFLWSYSGDLRCALILPGA